jgi:hypothetical protein
VISRLSELTGPGRTRERGAESIELGNYDSLGAATIKSTGGAIASSSRRDIDAVFSPDGTRIVLSSDRDGSTELWITEHDGTNQRQLTIWAALAYSMRPTGHNGRRTARRLCLRRALPIAARRTSS